jgi:hypothetical protein
MGDVADVVVETVFGVMLTAGHYEARPGQLVFRGGRLVGLRFARHHQESDDGLTVGLTLFPVPPARGGPARAVVRVYSRGALDGETDLGDVTVEADTSTN